jgi:hypothetical protein
MKIWIKELNIEMSYSSWSHGEKQVWLLACYYALLCFVMVPRHAIITVRDAALFFNDITVKAMVPASFSPLR